MAKCLMCKESSVSELLDLGKQPVSSRFLKLANEKEYKHPMAVGQCRSCGLVQLMTPFPPEKLKPQYRWITYNEPEAHLDKLAKDIAALPGIAKNSVISGLSFKDDSLLERLKNMGFNNVWRISPENDLGVKEPHIGVETIQAKLSINQVKRVLQNHRKPDIVIARHIAEHAYDITEFFNVLKQLIDSDGFIVLEVPDCSKAFELGDVTMLWEEHISYFTQATFQNLFKLNGCPLSYFRNFSYPLENSLVGIAKIKNDAFYTALTESVGKEVELAAKFVDKVNKKRISIKKFFSQYSKNVGKISLFGAGHLTCLYINFFDLKDYVEFVVDDNKHKKGLYMPGSRLQICGSEDLLKGISLCLLGVNPNVEDKVINNNKLFAEYGGVFLSIFEGSRHSLQLNDNTPDSKALNLIPYNDEVFISSDRIIKIGKEELEMLKKMAIKNTRKRARICAHRNPNDPVHEMLIALSRGAYIRPHKHLNKPESFHLISGLLDVITFNEEGNITEIIPVGDYTSGKTLYYRMDKPYYHMLFIRSDVIVFHEATKGPFSRRDTEFAKWAPKEDESLAVEKFMRRIEKSIGS